MGIIIGKLFFGIILILIGSSLDDGLNNELIGGGVILILDASIIDIIRFIIENRGRLKFYFHSKLLALTGQSIRFSMSYQYRIKVNDKYLLVKNSNKDMDWFQHVGGKYKRLPEAMAFLKSINAVDDIKMKTHGLKKDDLAIFVPAKYAVKFLNWFNKSEDREISHWREFYEELIEGKEHSSILSQANFPHVKYRFIKSVRTPIKKTPEDSGWNCYEVLQYDVLDVILTEKQEKELEELLKNGDTNYYKWASAELIQKLGYDNHSQQKKYNIGAHTKWVLNLKWNKK